MAVGVLSSSVPWQEPFCLQKVRGRMRNERIKRRKHWRIRKVGRIRKRKSKWIESQWFCCRERDCLVDLKEKRERRWRNMLEGILEMKERTDIQENASNFIFFWKEECITTHQAGSSDTHWPQSTALWIALGCPGSYSDFNTAVVGFVSQLDGCSCSGSLLLSHCPPALQASRLCSPPSVALCALLSAVWLKLTVKFCQNLSPLKFCSELLANAGLQNICMFM